MRNTVRIVVRSSDPEELRALIRQEELDLNCGGAKQSREGEWQLEAFVSPEVASRLSAAGYRIEIDDQAAQRAAERRSEVARGDRFEGGRVPPRGLGKKE